MHVSICAEKIVNVNVPLQNIQIKEMDGLKCENTKIFKSRSLRSLEYYFVFLIMRFAGRYQFFNNALSIIVKMRECAYIHNIHSCLQSKPN